jgi:deoxyribonuclease IV
LQRLPLIGAHVSAAGGWPFVLARAAELKAQAVQVFPWNPRRWAAPSYGSLELSDLGARLRHQRLPLYAHAIYLINPASPDLEIRRKSALALAQSFVFATLTGAEGVVSHVGSHRGSGFRAGVERFCETLQEALDASARALAAAAGRLPPLLLEGSANSGDATAQDLRQLSELRTELQQRTGLPVGLCLDTAHLFAAGHPIHTEEGLEDLLGELRREGALASVALVHLNDSRSSLGSRADRHENLWQGKIGRRGLAPWLHHPLLRDVPFVLEVPGFDGKGPDRRNLRRARILRASRAAGALA